MIDFFVASKSSRNSDLWTMTALRHDTSSIYKDLHHRLVSARFAPSEKLKSQELCREYGCSGNTIREVLFRLSSVGLVTFEEQKGFRVRDVSPARRHDVARFRILLEQEGAVLSMQHGGLEWESRLAAAHHRLSHIERRLERDASLSEDMALWGEAEWEFHDTLISACRSDLLRETFASIYGQFRQQMVSQERDFGADYFQAIIQEHQSILDAALSRNEVECRVAIYDHFKRNLV